MTEDQKAYFVEAVYQNINIILKVCNIYAAESEKEDLKQEIIYQLWKSYSSFRKESKFQTWMYRIALNTAMLSLRKKTIKTTELRSEVQITQEESFDENQLRSKVKELYAHISKFNDLDKAVIFLYIERCSYKEIAEITGISEKNVSVKLVRMRKKLKKMFNIKNV